MAFQWMRRALIGLASASLLLLGACGSGTIESQFKPDRAIVFGDGFSDLGQTGARYTVNDGSLNWSQLVASNYGITLKPVVSGGTSYATGNARVIAKPDAAGSTATPTIQEQIDTFLAGSTLGANDLVIIGGGYSDIIVQMQAYRAGSQTSEQMIANLKQAGQDLATQAKRLVAAGSNHVVVVGTYDLGKSPWAVGIGQQTLLSTASAAFNDALLVALVDQGNNMLYVDAPLIFNLMYNSPSSYNLANVTTPVCNSVDAGPGIGLGTGQVNSKLCTTATILTGANYSVFLYADAVYPGPTPQVQFGDYAYAKVHNRW